MDTKELLKLGFKAPKLGAAHTLKASGFDFWYFKGSLVINFSVEVKVKSADQVKKIVESITGKEIN